MSTRTTLTLDDDVAALLARVQKTRKESLKSVANEALRQGLRGMTAPPPRRKPYQSPSWDLGKCLIDNLDNIEEVLDIVEGPLRK
ncbi:MAG: hypothetical protein ACREEE_14380 [Dongiaceae bacterium]